MVNADELFNGAEKLKAFSRKLDKVPQARVTAVDFNHEEPSDWVVVKNVGETRTVVGWNQTEKSAKLLAASQKPKIFSEDEDFLLLSYQIMTEEKAKKEGLLKN